MTNNDKIKQPAVIGVTQDCNKYQGKPTSLLDINSIPQKNNKIKRKSKKWAVKFAALWNIHQGYNAYD